MRRIPLLAACCLTLALTNCKKNDNNASNPTSTGTQLNRLFAALKTTPQPFTVTAGTATKIYGNKGTIISFYPNSFKDKNGAIVTSGTVNIDLVEMYSVGDMIANRAGTSMTGGVLTSSGQVNIKATMGGQKVYANKYGIGFKAVTNNRMELYYGNGDGTSSEVAWTVADTTKPGALAPVVTLVSDTTRNWYRNPYYFFDSATRFDYVNCDHPYDATCQNVSIKVTMQNNTFTAQNTSLCVCYPAKNVVILVHPKDYNASGAVTFEGFVPVGPSCKLVLLTDNIINNIDNLYFYSQTCTLTDGLNVSATMTSETAAGILAKLSGL